MNLDTHHRPDETAPDSTPPQAPSLDAASVQTTLKTLLLERLGDRADQADFGPQTRLRDLGINSVDYMKFVLSVEDAFDLEIPDEVLDSDTLTSVEDWTKMLCNATR